ncbi:hypothetical protein CEXT_636001 [Caerostris extrusa]|uniref:Uncharacterized protein n=1 Tax=Caerostris extrusa TaxID=172846 RepID=A0AAV4VP81_CAEEX|nr:hypothetical protein CEXT_636001 [Caerostris extrusa]
MKNYPFFFDLVRILIFIMATMQKLCDYLKRQRKILEYTKPPEQVEELVSILNYKSELQLKGFIKVLEEEDESGCRPYPWLAEKLKITNYLNDNVDRILTNGTVPFPINHLLS